VGKLYRNDSLGLKRCILIFYRAYCLGARLLGSTHALPYYRKMPRCRVGRRLPCVSKIRNTTKSIFAECARNCNISGFKAKNREETDVCIIFMHRKFGKFLRFLIKLIKVIEVSLKLMEWK
jgi:hypothetical protein